MRTICNVIVELPRECKRDSAKSPPLYDTTWARDFFTFEITTLANVNWVVPPST